jgi:DEAD/DEAH box helicase domain-containing protein
VSRQAAGLEDDRPSDLESHTHELSLQPPVTPRRADLPAVCAHGEVHVVSRVVGFKKIKFYTNENVGSGELDLPEQQMHTTAYWLTIPAAIMATLACGGADRRDGVVGLAHAMRNIAPLLLMCDGRDLGASLDGVSLEGGNRVGGIARGEAPAELAAEPTIFLYDNYPGGIGLSEPLFGMHDALLDRTRELIGECPCESGCPSCVGPEGATGPLAKTVASELLRRLTAVPAA